jgi:tripartite-type tricarboxylate transporter receptor subunit TctC
MPDVPTVDESGIPGYETTAWFGLIGPAGMPKEIVDKIQQELAHALADPKIKERLSGQGLTLIGGKPQEFKTFLGEELDKWAKVVKESGAKID